MINVKRYFRVNQNIQSQSFQTVSRWTDAGSFNEGFAVRLYCGNIPRLGIGIEQSTIGRLVDYRPENADYRLSTFEKKIKSRLSTIDISTLTIDYRSQKSTFELIDFFFLGRCTRCKPPEIFMEELITHPVMPYGIG